MVNSVQYKCSLSHLLNSDNFLADKGFKKSVQDHSNSIYIKNKALQLWKERILHQSSKIKMINGLK